MSLSNLRQSMTWFHTWIGLLLCWVMYFMFVTGTLGYFDEEIDQYMMPEIPHHESVSPQEQLDAVFTYARQNAMAAEQWFIDLEAKRSGMLSRIFYRLPDAADPEKQVRHNVYIDPRNAQSIEGVARETAGGQTLYRMHWRLHYVDSSIAYYFIGIVTLFMFIGVVSGIIIHRKIFTDFFTFRPQSNGKGWLDIHNLASVTSLPFQLMISYSGLLFMVTTYLPLIAFASYGFDVKATTETVRSGLRVTYESVPSGEPAEVVSPETLMKNIAQKVSPNEVESITVYHPGDANAMALIRVYDSFHGARMPLTMLFSAVTGEYQETLPRSVNASMSFNAIMLDLHEGLFADTDLRWLYFVAGTLGCVMMGSGTMYYVRKRRTKLRRNAEIPRNLRNIEATNVAVILGLLAGIAAFFIANRLLPVDMQGREDWEVHCMFLVWLGCFIHAYLRQSSKAWVEQAILVATLFLMLPIVNFFKIEQHLLNAISSDNWVYAGTDLMALAMSCGFYYLAYRLSKSTLFSEVKQLHTTKMAVGSR